MAFKVYPDTKQIDITRGNYGVLRVSVKNESDGSDYVFSVDDVIRFKVFDAKDCNKVYLEKDVTVSEESTTVDIPLYEDETKIGEIQNKHKDYWYEVELNPDTDYCQTIVGYEIDGKKKLPKIFRVLPEGGDEE